MSPPPNFQIEHRGFVKMHVSTCFDWFSITFPHETRIEGIVPYKFDLRPTKSPIPVYGVALEALPHGMKILLSDNVRMGKHVILSGKVLTSLRKAGFTARVLFEHFKRLGGKFSRCDIALDIVDSDDFAVGVFKEKMTEVETSLSGYKYIASQDSVETLYIGNMRSKSRKLRIYDKGIEQGLPIFWTRVEYEKRRGADNMINKMMLDNQSIKSVIKSVVDFPNWHEWQGVIGDDIADTSRGHGQSVPSDWQLKLNWLVESCAPALADCMYLEAKENIFDEDFSLDNGVVLNTFLSALNAKIAGKFK